MSNAGQPIYRRTEVVVAAIGLLGVVIGNLLPNWDKIFNPTVEANYHYRPTEDYETELRHYLSDDSYSDVGSEQFLNQWKLAWLEKYPDCAKTINLAIETAKETLPSYGEIIKQFEPIYRKHYKLEELQELNKFYSTDIMLKMAQREPQIQQELARIQAPMILQLQEKMIQKLKEKMGPLVEAQETSQLIPPAPEFSCSN